MCGITGSINLKGKDSPQTLKKMVSALSHRGPDDHGMWHTTTQFGYVGLGHVRLSILDLSAQGHQPFVGDNGRLVLVYNGEIYNFESVKKTLIQKGVSFRSHSDTEVLLAAYQQWGLSCLDRFIGMFAFCLYDQVQQKVYFVRDRVGVKPLYIYQKDDQWLFGSELKSICAHPHFIPRIDDAAFAAYTQLGYVPGTGCIYRSVRKLNPGHYLELDLTTGTHHTQAYWQLKAAYQKEKFDGTETEILEGLSDLISDAFRLRTVSDVPVGVFLSGGIDSSLVAATLAHAQSEPIRTFTMGFDQTGYNEAPFAKSIADYLGADHHEFYCKPSDIREFVDTLPMIYDEPMADDSCIPTLLLSKLTRQHVKVVLSADGGDEVFGGYSKYSVMRKIFGSTGMTLKSKILAGVLMGIPDGLLIQFNRLLPPKKQITNLRQRLLKLRAALGGQTRADAFLALSSVVSESDRRKVCHADVGSYFAAWDGLDLDLGPTEALTAIDFLTFLVDDVLVKVDRATMAYGLEGREPMLDHRLIEFVARVPESIKYKTNKWMLRRLLSDRLPDSLINRPKMGFQLPLFEWMRGDFESELTHYLSLKRLQETDLVDAEAVVDMVKAYRAGAGVNVHLLWHLLVFEKWRDHWVNR